MGRCNLRKLSPVSKFLFAFLARSTGNRRRFPFRGKAAGSLGSLWESLRTPGSLWELWSLWEPLGVSGSLWELLGTSGSLWKSLGASGNLWEGILFASLARWKPSAFSGFSFAILVAFFGNRRRFQLIFSFATLLAFLGNRTTVSVMFSFAAWVVFRGNLQSFSKPPNCPFPWEALAGSGRLWEALGSLGRLWETLGGSGRLWEAMGGALEDCRKPWEACVSLIFVDFSFKIIDLY